MKNDPSKIEPCYKKLGELVAAGRNTLNLSQPQLADLIGLCRVSVANIEAGRQRVMLHDIIKLASIFRIDLNELKVGVKMRLEFE